MGYNYDKSHNSPNYTPSSQARAVFGYDRIIEGITIHHWGDPKLNPQFSGVRDYLCRPNGNSSAHLVVSGTNRSVACIVNYTDVAWHAGSAWGNAKTIGVELDPRARDEDYDVAAEVVADLRAAFGDVPIYWHSYFSNTACPGAWDPVRLDKLSYTKYSDPKAWGKGGNKVATQPAPQPTPVPTVHPQQQVPSPTSGQPDSGKPVAEKDDYAKENNDLLKQILALVQSILAKLTSVFK